MKTRVGILAALVVCAAASTSMAGGGLAIQRQTVVESVRQSDPVVQHSSRTYVSVTRPACPVVVRRWVRAGVLVAGPRWVNVRVRVADGPAPETAVGVHVGGYYHGHVVVRSR